MPGSFSCSRVDCAERMKGIRRPRTHFPFLIGLITRDTLLGQRCKEESLPGLKMEDKNQHIGNASWFLGESFFNYQVDFRGIHVTH